MHQGAHHRCPVSSVSRRAQQWLVCKWSSRPKQLIFLALQERGEARKDCSQLSDIFHRESTSAKHYANDKEAGSLFFLHECSYFVGESDKITAGQNTLAWVNINRSSSLFLLDPCAWKQWVVGHFISRKRVRLPVHIVSMMAIYFAGSGTTSMCVCYGMRPDR